jgi:molybdopterin-guanine dinucleotide biosynthesis protein B
MKRLHIIGRKNSGKTTLVVELVEHLTARGLKVGTIKHTHHSHELDVPGKDSFKHRAAGAAAVGILSPGMTAVFCPTDDATGHKRYDLMAPMFADCDLVLVEGDSTAPATRVEVWRRDNGGEAPYAVDDSEIAAVISDDAVQVDALVLKRTPIDQLSDRLLALASRATTPDSN